MAIGYTTAKPTQFIDLAKTQEIVEVAGQARHDRRLGVKREIPARWPESETKA